MKTRHGLHELIRIKPATFWTPTSDGGALHRFSPLLKAPWRMTFPAHSKTLCALLTLMLQFAFLILNLRATPTNNPTAGTYAVTIDTNSVLVGTSTNLFKANSNLLAQAGVAGPQGPTGATGATGPQGPAGTNNNIVAGTGLNTSTNGNNVTVGLTTPIALANGGTGASALAGSNGVRATFGGGQFLSSDLTVLPAVANFTGLSGDNTGQIAISHYGQLAHWREGIWDGTFQFTDSILAWSSNNIHKFWVSNGIDNCIQIRNFDLNHFSAVQLVDAAGNEQGAVGWGNTNATIYAGWDYFEKYAGTTPIWFTGISANGVNRTHLMGLETNGNFVVWDKSGTNTALVVKMSDNSIQAAGKFTSFNGLTPYTSEQSFPVVVYGGDIGTNLTTQFNNVTLYTVPANADGTFQIDTLVQSTASGTAGTLMTTWNYTDQFGTSQTVSACSSINLGNAVGTIANNGIATNNVVFFHAKKNTTIGITTSIAGGGGGSAYALDIEMMQIR